MPKSWQSIELGSGAVMREVVAAHFDAKRKEARTFYNCGKVGYGQADCRSKGRNDGGNPNNASGNGSMVRACRENDKRESKNRFT